jgi:hypothetical protein
MGSIRKPGPYNPQKATAYVGKGVLKQGGNITPVPNGHLIKKDGTSLKNGGKVKSAFKKVNKSINPSDRNFWMNKVKRDISQVQPSKTKKKK